MPPCQAFLARLRHLQIIINNRRPLSLGKNVSRGGGGGGAQNFKRLKRHLNKPRKLGAYAYKLAILANAASTLVLLAKASCWRFRSSSTTLAGARSIKLVLANLAA